MKNNDHVPPHWIAVKLDESEHCDPEFLARCGGKVYGVYLVDTNSVTYCCSPVKTYCLNLVDTVPEAFPEDSDESEKLFDELSQCTFDCSDTAYMECRYVDDLSDENKVLQPFPEDWAEDGEDRGFEDVRESYCGTPDF